MSTQDEVIMTGYEKPEGPTDKEWAGLPRVIDSYVEYAALELVRVMHNAPPALVKQLLMTRLDAIIDMYQIKLPLRSILNGEIPSAK